MLYTGTAISALASEKLTNEFTPSAQLLKTLSAMGREADEVIVSTILLGVHTQEDDTRERVRNPKAVNPANEWTYFVEVVTPLVDIVRIPGGRIAFAHALYEHEPEAQPIFFKPSGITTRLVYLANGLQEKVRSNGQAVRLMGGQGEILHQFINGSFSSQFISDAEKSRLAGHELAAYV